MLGRWLIIQPEVALDGFMEKVAFGGSPQIWFMNEKVPVAVTVSGGEGMQKRWQGQKSWESPVGLHRLFSFALSEIHECGSENRRSKRRLYEEAISKYRLCQPRHSILPLCLFFPPFFLICFFPWEVQHDVGAEQYPWVRAEEWASRHLILHRICSAKDTHF